MLVNITVEEVMDNLAAAGCGYDPAVLDRLWAAVPDDLRLARLSAMTVPERYRNAFTEASPRTRSSSGDCPSRCAAS